MNNNNIYNNNNFIGTIHQDIFKNTSNILSKQIINTSNILTNQITNTSNNLTNQINRINTDNSNYTLQIGNIVENNSIIYTNQLRYDVNKLINEEFEHISFPIPYDTHHTYVYNSNIGGDIRFYTESTKYYPMPFPSGEPPYRVKIDSSGKLFLYYTYDPFINATFFGGWVDIINTVVALNADSVNQGVLIGGLKIQIDNNWNLVQEQFLAVLLGLENDLVIGNSSRVLIERDLQNLIENGSLNGVNSSVDSIFNNLQGFVTTGRMARLNLATTAITFRISQNPIVGYALGVGGAAFGLIYGLVAASRHHDFLNLAVAQNIDKNPHLTSNEKEQAQYVNINNMNSNIIDQALGYYDLGLTQGFINYNVETRQNIPSLSTSNLSILNSGNITGVNTINGSTGIFKSISTTNSGTVAVPSIGNFGGIGDKIILSTGTPSTYPYSLGIDTNSIWLSSPDNIKFYNNGINTVSILNNNDLECSGKIKENNIYLNDVYTSSNYLINTSNNLVDFVKNNYLTTTAGLAYNSWTKNGNDIYQTIPSGNIGIGTNTNIGKVKLLVNGIINTNGILSCFGNSSNLYPNSSANFIVLKHNTFNSQIGANFPNPECAFIMANNTSANILSWCFYNGVVKYFASSTPITSLRYDIGTCVINNTLATQSGTNTFTPLISALYTGNVGIGTINPFYKFDVNGPINSSNILKNGLNIDNIYISSNTLFNNILPIYDNLNITNNINNSSNYLKKTNIILPISQYQYDGPNAVYYYDLNVEQYVPSLLKDGYKSRAYRIETWRPNADYRTGNNIFFNNKLINNLESLTIYQNNNSNVLGISFPSDSYNNCVIYGKIAEGNIGTWNSVSDNYNYIRYIAYVPYELYVCIENLYT